MAQQSGPDKATPPAKKGEVQGATYKMLYGKAMAKEAEMNANSTGNIDGQALEKKRLENNQKNAQMNYEGSIDIEKKTKSNRRKTKRN